MPVALTWLGIAALVVALVVGLVIAYKRIIKRAGERYAASHRADPITREGSDITEIDAPTDAETRVIPHQ